MKKLRYALQISLNRFDAGLHIAERGVRGEVPTHGAKTCFSALSCPRTWGDTFETSRAQRQLALNFAAIAFCRLARSFWDSASTRVWLGLYLRWSAV